MKRIPFAEAGSKILTLSKDRQITGFIAAHTFDTLFYLMRNSYSKEQTYASIRTIREAVVIAPVTQTVIDRALNLNWNDFEDAIHYQAATAAGCEAIITRNGKDFKKAEIPVLTPQEFLDQLGSDKGE
jgi:predicted nucleic acid-binding protein